jgi:hypothetical protein
VIAFGLAAIAFGIWTLFRAHSQVGTCTTNSATGAAAHSGIDSTCVQTVMSYSLGAVYVASGVIIAIIALTMIARQERIDLHAELKAVPRTWGKRQYETTSDGLDGRDGVNLRDRNDVSPEVVVPPRFTIETS